MIEPHPPDETPTLTRFTVEDVVRMGEAGLLRDDRRYELLDGILYEMNAPGARHQDVVRKVAFAFIRALLSKGIDPEPLVRQAEALYRSETRYRLPDLMVLAAPPLDDQGEPRLARPEDVRLLVEVSFSTYPVDAGEKLREYARAGIPEYWIVRCDSWPDRSLEVYRDPVHDVDDPHYQTRHTPGLQDTVEATSFPQMGTFVAGDLLS